MAFLAGAVSVIARPGDRLKDFPHVFMRHPAAFLVGAVAFALVPVVIGAVAGNQDPSGLRLMVARVCGVAALAGQVATYLWASSKPANWEPPGWVYWGRQIQRDAFRRRLLIGMIPIAVLVVLAFLISS